VRDDGHAKARRAARDLAADAADAHKTERFSAELPANELRACPFAGADAAVAVSGSGLDSTILLIGIAAVSIPLLIVMALLATVLTRR